MRTKRVKAREKKNKEKEVGERGRKMRNRKTTTAKSKNTKKDEECEEVEDERGLQPSNRFTCKKETYEGLLLPSHTRRLMAFWAVSAVLHLHCIQDAFAELASDWCE